MRVAVEVVRFVGVQAVAEYLDVRVALAQVLHVGPVGSGTPAIEQAGSSQDQGAGADRADATYSWLGGT
ncbi:hypothetical protein D9M68_864420 [compost metagenome]